MGILDLQAASGFAYESGTGTPGAITVLAKRGVKLISVRAPAGADCTFTIAPGGANNAGPATAGSTITVLAGTGFSEGYLAGQLGPGTVITITGSATYYISYYVIRSGI